MTLVTIIGKKKNIPLSIIRSNLLHFDELDVFSHHLGSAILHTNFFRCKGGTVTHHFKLDFYAEYNAAIRF
jgi:hypothetical protein